MNQLVLDDRYFKNIWRLALGIEPIDAQRLHRVAHPLSIMVERPPKASAKPQVMRHPSCLHVLLYYPELVDSVAIRIFEDFRRFAPRRVTVPLHTLATVENFPYTHRVRRPYLYPGSAYDLDSCATGIRGRVVRAGKPMRWARVQAVLLSSGQVVGRAHGDDRGEFLLVIAASASPIGDLVSPVTLQVTVFGPATIPVPPTLDVPLRDPLWDLPLEVSPAPGAPDKVSTGETLPVNYTANTVVNVDFVLGELRSGLAAFTIT